MGGGRGTEREGERGREREREGERGETERERDGERKREGQRGRCRDQERFVHGLVVWGKIIEIQCEKKNRRPCA